MRHDTFVLSLLWRETRNLATSARASDLAWVVLGGGAFLAYGAGVAVVALQRASQTLLTRQEPWIVALLAAFALGLAGGVLLSRLAWSRACAPFLKALPLAVRERARMAAVATLALGAPFALLAGALVGAAGELIAKPDAAVWGLGAAISCAAGVITGLCPHLVLANDDAPQGLSTPFAPPAKTVPIPLLGALERAAPAWLGAWACGLPAGELRLTARLVASALLFVLAAALAIGASLARHQAAPAAVAATLGGLAAFMFGLRCHPLGSPVLRATPLTFVSAWLRLSRLPLALSALCFVAPASAAVIAEPSAWAAPVASGLCLLVLNGVYAVFAGFFLYAPSLAAFAFFVAVAYTAYESIEFGGAVLVGFAALVALLWHRSLRRYRDG